MNLPRVSSSGLSRGSSDLRASALVDGWMAGTSPAMTVVDVVRKAKGPATGEIVTTWEMKQ